MKETGNKNAGDLNRAIRGALAGLGLAVLTWSAKAQGVAPPSNALPRNPRPAVPFVELTASKPQTAGAEGVTVHGHWIIDVVNRDGTIVEHRDFENALVPAGGGAVLAGLLTGILAPQTFDVVLAGTGTTALLYFNGQSCPQALVNFQGGDCSPTLTQSLTGGGTVILLKSTYTPAAALTINKVSTNIGTCPTLSGGVTPVSAATCVATTSGTIPGSGGAGVGIYNFTAATIADVAVAPGQSVSLTVSLSFS